MRNVLNTSLFGTFDNLLNESSIFNTSDSRVIFLLRLIVLSFLCENKILFELKFAGEPSFKQKWQSNTE